MVVGIACGSAMVAAVMFIAVYLGIRLRGYWTPAACLESDLADFSLACYEPMTRLLTGQDLDFLKAQPGYRPEVGQKFLRERRRIFRLYLTDLAADFRALHACARQMVANSGAQHADLVGALLRQQFTFWRALAAIEFRLMTGGLGFADANVRGLIDAMEAMRAELTRIAAAPSAA